MIARPVRQLAVIDEDDGAAILRHQRVRQRQRRMRDVGAADVEGPGHRVAVRQHQRVDAELDDLEPDPLQLLGFDLAGKLRAVDRDRAERRFRALGPDRIQRIALHGHQLRAGLGAGGGEALSCRRSVQPRVKTEAVAGRKVAPQPVFRRRIGQRLDMPGLAVDLLGSLQRVAAIDEHRGLVGQHHGHAGRAGKTGQPGQPLLRRGDIFILLLIGAGNHESSQLAARQLLAEGGQPRTQRDAAFGLFECLEMGFEHGLSTLGAGGTVRNPIPINEIWHNLCLNFIVRVRSDGTPCGASRSSRVQGGSRSVSTQRRGDTRCLLSRLRRFRRRYTALLFLRLRTRSSVGSSSRCWTGSSKPASSAACPRTKVCSPAIPTDLPIKARPFHHQRTCGFGSWPDPFRLRRRYSTRRSSRLLQPSMRRWRTGTSPRAR